jgi:hypothetical protein
MPLRNLTEYIKKARERDLDDKNIKKKLKESNWTEEQIKKAFVKLNSNKKPNTKESKKKVFLIALIGGFVLGLVFLYFLISNQEITEIEAKEDITQSSHKTLKTKGFSVFGDIDFSFTDKEKDQEVIGNIIAITELEKILEKYGLYFLAEGTANDTPIRAKANVVAMNNELYVRWLELFDLSLLFSTSLDNNKLTGRYLLLTDNLSGAIKKRLNETKFQKEVLVLLGIDTDIETTKEIYNSLLNKAWKEEALAVVDSEKEGLLMNKNKYELNIDFQKLFNILYETLEEKEEEIEFISSDDLVNLEEKRQYFTTLKENIDYSINVWTENDYIQKVVIDINSKGEIEKDNEFEFLIDLEFRDIDEKFELGRPESYLHIEEITEQE